MIPSNGDNITLALTLHRATRILHPSRFQPLGALKTATQLRESISNPSHEENIHYVTFIQTQHAFESPSASGQ